MRMTYSASFLQVLYVCLIILIYSLNLSLLLGEYAIYYRVRPLFLLITERIQAIYIISLFLS